MSSAPDHVVPLISAEPPAAVARSSATMVSALILVREAALRARCQKTLSRYCALVELACDPAMAEKLVRRCHFDLLLVDQSLCRECGLDWLEGIHAAGEWPGVILVAAHTNAEVAQQALRMGATDFLEYPFEEAQLARAVQRCLARHSRSRAAVQSSANRGPPDPIPGMVGRSPAVEHVWALVRRVARQPSTVLVYGASGTGKELVARAIHELSGRSGMFVPVNCGSISPELLESELFGHVRGAFTSAHQAREGLFSFASGGTLFLDEIGEMPLPLQAKLLRVLEERTVRPVGAEREVSVDARVVAATNQRLERAVAQGRFRADLFYRINVVNLALPELRRRSDDIPLLAQHFLDTLAARLEVRQCRLETEDVEALQAHGWPGNVRELRNVIERSLLLGLPVRHCLSESLSPVEESAEVSADGDYPLSWSLDQVEKRHILRVLHAAQGNKTEAARRLGISRKTLERKLAAWG